MNSGGTTSTVGQTRVKVVGLLSGTTGRISGIVTPKDGGLSVPLLNVRSGMFVDVSIGRTQVFGTDTYDFDEGGVEMLDLIVDLGVGEGGDGGVPKRGKIVVSTIQLLIVESFDRR